MPLSPVSKALRDAEVAADLDRDFRRELAEENRRRPFRCRDCLGVDRHRQNCPNDADDEEGVE